MQCNVIAENMLAQVDDEGFSQTMMEALIDHKHDDTADPNGGQACHCQSGQQWLRKNDKRMETFGQMERWN